jgi:hypothetical protein
VRTARSLLLAWSCSRGSSQQRSPCSSPPRCAGILKLAWQLPVSLVWAVVTVAGSVAWAALGLFRARLARVAVRALPRVARPLRAVHSGHIGDYVAWLTFGVAVLGGVFALTLR